MRVGFDEDASEVAFEDVIELQQVSEGYLKMICFLPCLLCHPRGLTDQFRSLFAISGIGYSTRDRGLCYFSYVGFHHFSRLAYALGIMGLGYWEIYL